MAIKLAGTTPMLSWTELYIALRSILGTLWILPLSGKYVLLYRGFFEECQAGTWERTQIAIEMYIISALLYPSEKRLNCCILATEMSTLAVCSQSAALGML